VNAATPTAATGEGFVDGARACLPTLLGYLSIGFSAGAVAWIAGLQTAEVALMSLLVYAGSGQFVLASMFSSHASMASIWIAVFIVNLRHVLMSSYISTLCSGMSATRGVAVGAQLTDETFGVAAVQGQRTGRLALHWMLGLNLTAYLGWLVGNVAGAGASSLLPQPLIAGLGFALVAMFIGLVVLQLMGSPDRLAQALAGLLSMALLMPAKAIMGPSFGVIVASMAACTVALGVGRWTSARTSR
jgi:4-azaleucine resistance transporter AzlC